MKEGSFHDFAFDAVQTNIQVYVIPWKYEACVPA